MAYLIFFDTTLPPHLIFLRPRPRPRPAPFPLLPHQIYPAATTGHQDPIEEEVLVGGLLLKTRRPCTKDDEDDDNVCAVCLDDLNGKMDIGILDHCRHEFHAACITKWLNKKNVCPMCRATALGRRHD